MKFISRGLPDRCDLFTLSYNEKNHLGEPVRSGGGAGVAPEAGGVAHQGQAQQSKQPHIRLSDNWN